MNASILDFAYWSFATERMNFNWEYVIKELVALSVLTVLVGVYAWFIENDNYEYPLMKNQNKVQSIQTFT